MGFLARLFAPAAPRAAATDWFTAYPEPAPRHGAVAVGPGNVLTLAAVFQSVRIIAGDVMQLPLPVYQRTDAGRDRAKRHPAHRLLNGRANPCMTAARLKFLLQTHALLWGNGRAAIVRNGRGEPERLVPLAPHRTRCEVRAGEKYHVTRRAGEANETAIRDADVIHIQNTGDDGIEGRSVVALARDSFGLGLGAERYGNQFLANGGAGRVVLQSERKIADDALRQMAEGWRKSTEGPDRAGKTVVLQEGVEAKVLSMSNEDAQWLETRKFQRGEVASWFNLPPHKLGDDSRVSYNSLEQENRAYLDNCIGPWLAEWEAECNDKLLSDAQRLADSHYVEFDLNKRLRADYAARMEGYAKGVAGRWLSPNEVRAKENMNRVDGLDEYANPNTSPAAATDGTK